MHDSVASNTPVSRNVPNSQTREKIRIKVFALKCRELSPDFPAPNLMLKENENDDDGKSEC